MEKERILKEIAKIIGTLKWLTQLEKESDDYNRRIIEEEKNKLLDKLSELYKLIK